MSLIFYYVPMSTSSITEAILQELDIQYQGVELDIDAGDTQKPEFLAVNPNGRVPVIVHDGVTLWESAAITLYLGETFAVEQGLFPEQGPLRGEAMKWVVWANVNLAEAAGRLAAELPPEMEGAVQEGSKDFVPVVERRPSALAKASQDLLKSFAILNNELAQKHYLLNEYSIVDTHLFVLVGWILSMGVPLLEYPNIEQWMMLCSERPVLAAMMGDEEE